MLVAAKHRSKVLSNTELEAVALPGQSQAMHAPARALSEPSTFSTHFQLIPSSSKLYPNFHKSGLWIYMFGYLALGCPHSFQKRSFRRCWSPYLCHDEPYNHPLCFTARLPSLQWWMERAWEGQSLFLIVDRDIPAWQQAEHREGSWLWWGQGDKHCTKRDPRVFLQETNHWGHGRKKPAT